MIFKRLRPIRYGLPGLAIVLFAAALFLEVFRNSEGAFEKSGGLVVAIAVICYFVLERLDYLTGHDGENMDSAYHSKPKRYLALTEALTVAMGTLVATFGDWIVDLIMKTGCSCSS